MEYGSIKVSGLRFVGKRDMTAFFIDKGRIVERRCYEKKQILFYSCCRCLMVFGLSMSAQAKNTYTLEITNQYDTEGTGHYRRYLG